MHYKKPNLFCYRLTQAVSRLAATLVFHRKIIRNEIKGRKGPFVVIANHQAMLDFVNLIDMTSRPMTFVISKSFYTSLPITGFMKKLGVIPKQQFQTTVPDMKAMKAVIDAGQPLVIYPAGLMCENGLSTPIPKATYKFLKWLNVDIYVAKVSGTYFAMPKWGKGLRPGKTFIDVYRLFSQEELAHADLQTVQKEAEDALLFDAYREQANCPVAYWGNRNIQGLENVLYQCPVCGTEFSITASQKDTLSCSHCGYTQTCDRYGFFHKTAGPGEEIPYVSDWSQWIYEDLKAKILSGQISSLHVKTAIYMTHPAKHAFRQVGVGELELTENQILLRGTLSGEDICLSVSTAGTPILPFSPGKHLEVQHGGDIYRCVLEDGRMVMKFINMLKIYFQLQADAFTK